MLYLISFEFGRLHLWYYQWFRSTVFHLVSYSPSMDPVFFFLMCLLDFVKYLCKIFWCLIFFLTSGCQILNRWVILCLMDWLFVGAKASRHLSFPVHAFWTTISMVRALVVVFKPSMSDPTFLGQIRISLLSFPSLLSIYFLTDILCEMSGWEYGM